MHSHSVTAILSLHSAAAKGSLSGVEHDSQATRLARTQHTQLHGLARGAPFERQHEVVIGPNRRIFNLYDDVAELDCTVTIASGGEYTGPISPAAGLDRDDQCPFDPQALAELRARQLDAQGRTAQLAVLDQFGNDPLDGVYGDGETDASIGAGGAVDRGVDADQAPAGIEQRTTRVTGVDGSVGLDDVPDG